MGKASILADLGDGEYSVMLRRERTRLVAQLARLATENTEIDARIVEKEARQPVLLAEMEAAEAVFNAAIAALPSPPSDEDLEAIKAVTETFRAARILYQSLVEEIAYLKLSRAANDKRIAKLNNQPDDETLTLWCADYSEGLSGDVGVIDIGLQDQRWGDVVRVIYPDDIDGTPGSAAWDNSRDGIFQPILGGTPASVFFNFAMAPGLEKWRPRYRKGVITEIDHGANTCTVALDALTHSSDDLEHETLDLNQSTEVAATIRYMTCNGIAFEVNDLVVVAFEGTDWAQPVVIGFQSHPKTCNQYKAYFYFSLNNQCTEFDISNLEQNTLLNSYTDNTAITSGYLSAPYNVCRVDDSIVSIFSVLKDYVSHIYEEEVWTDGTAQAVYPRYDGDYLYLYKNATPFVSFFTPSIVSAPLGTQTGWVASGGSKIFALVQAFLRTARVTWFYRRYYSVTDYEDLTAENFIDIPTELPAGEWITGIGWTISYSEYDINGAATSLPATNYLQIFTTAGTKVSGALFDVSDMNITTVSANEDFLFIQGTDQAAPADQFIRAYDHAGVFVQAFATTGPYASTDYEHKARMAASGHYVYSYVPDDLELSVYSTSAGIGFVGKVVPSFNAESVPPTATGAKLFSNYHVTAAGEHFALWRVDEYPDYGGGRAYNIQIYAFKVSGSTIRALGMVKEVILRSFSTGFFRAPLQHR